MVAPVKTVEENTVVHSVPKNHMQVKEQNEMIVKEPIAKIEMHLLLITPYLHPFNMLLSEKVENMLRIIMKHTDFYDLNPENVQDLATIVVGKNSEITFEKPIALEK